MNIIKLNFNNTVYFASHVFLSKDYKKHPSNADSEEGEAIVYEITTNKFYYLLFTYCYDDRKIEHVFNNIYLNNIDRLK